MNPSSLRVGLRLARRELRSRPARACLVVLMIVIPTAAMTVVTTFFRTSETSAELFHDADLGAAKYRMYFAGPETEAGSLATVYNEPRPEDIENLRRSVPAGTPILVETRVLDRVRGDDFVEFVDLVSVDLHDPLVRGRYDLVSGRPPAAADEAAVNRELADALHLDLGSVVTPERLGVPQRVVGIMRAGLGLGYERALVTLAPLPPRGSFEAFIGEMPAPPTVTGWVERRSYPYGLSHTDRVVWTYVGGAIGLFVLGTIVTAAFALGARRQLRVIGLLAASGAPPRTVAWALTAQGAITGVVGAAVGITLGYVGVRLVPLELLRSITARHATGAVTRGADLAPIAIIGVAAAMTAASFPARSASRLAVLQALASRRPLHTARRGSWLAVLATLALSAVLLAANLHSYGARRSNVTLLVIVFASVLPFVSALIAAPLVVARLERWSGGAPLPWRLAGRSLARNRARSASVVGATCAVVGLVIAGATLARSWYPDIDPNASLGSALAAHRYLQPNQVLLYSDYGVQADGYGYSNMPPVDAPLPPNPGVPAELIARVHKLLPSAVQVDLDRVVRADGTNPVYEFDVSAQEFAPTTYSNTPVLAIASPALLDVFDIRPALQTRLAAGDVVIVQPPGAPEVNLNKNVVDNSQVLHVGGVATSKQAALGLPRALIGAEAAAKRGWHTEPAGATAFVSPAEFTAAERKQLELLARDIQWEQDIADPVPPGTPFFFHGLNIGDKQGFGISPLAARAMGFAATALFVLGVVGLGLGLSARDNQDETAVLDAVGAPPRVRRQVGTRRAVLLVVVACAIALPAALVPVVATVLASPGVAKIRMDWFALVAAVVGLPLIVAAASAGAGWCRDKLRRAGPDVVAFAD